MPDNAQRDVILEIIHKHKDYLTSLESHSQMLISRNSITTGTWYALFAAVQRECVCWNNKNPSTFLPPHQATDRRIRPLKFRHPCLLEQRRRAKGICRVAGGTGSSRNQRKTERSRRGNALLYISLIVCGFFQGVRPGGRTLFCFAFNLLTHDSQPHSSNIPPARRSESNPHSPAGHCR